MFYRIKYLLAATILVCITLPPRVAFSQSESTNVEKKDASQENIPLLQANGLYRDGVKYYEQKKYQEALDKFQQALPILQQIGDKVGETATLNYIGQIYINLKQYSKASDILDFALNPELQSVAEPIGDTLPSEPSPSMVQEAEPIGDTLPSESSPSPMVQESVEPIGDTLPSEPIAQPCTSCTSIVVGETIISKTEKEELNGVIQNNLGLAYIYQGKYDKAEQSINQALAFFKLINHKTEQGNTLNNLGELYRHRSQYPKALEYLKQAKEIFQENKHQLGLGTPNNNIGLVHDELGQHHQALKHYQKSL